MSSAENEFAGIWLHDGERRGQAFTHSSADYDHPENEGGPPTRLRHAYVDQAGRKVGVWVPAHWSDDQVSAALETNW